MGNNILIKLSFILVLGVFQTNHAVAANVSLENATDQVEEQKEQRASKNEDQESKRKKVILFLKNHKKKIGAAVAMAVILYLLRDGGDGNGGGGGMPLRPGEPIPMHRGEKPDYLADAGWQENFLYHYRNFYYRIDHLFLYRSRVMSWRVRYLIYLLIHHPRLVIRALRELRFPEPERVRLN